MVTITGFETRRNSDGEPFQVLKLQGEVEMVRSKESGKLYATARETTVTSTFDEQTCEQLIGTELPGRIEKKECEPYEYIIPETGEEVILRHTYVYNPDANSLEGHVFENGQSGDKQDV